jgi:hypothetical protein
MKKTLLLFLGLFLAGWGYSQSASPSVIASYGDHINAGAFQLDYTVGEVIIETVYGDSLTMTQGFHQPNLQLISGIDELPELSVKVYPNPTAGLVQIQTASETPSLSWQLTNTKGQVLLQSKTATTSPSETLDLANFPAGTYWLSFRSLENRILKSFQIIKIK